MKDRPLIIPPSANSSPEEGESVVRRYRGRPTDYAPWMCEAVVQYGALGWSKAVMCAELMIARSTMDKWIAKHEEFGYAMEVAKQLAQRWWENTGQNNLTTTGFQGSVYSRSMAARFPEDWTERKEASLNLTTHEDWLARLVEAEASGALD